MTEMLELAHKDIKIARGKGKHEHNKIGSPVIKEIEEIWHWNVIWEPWLGNWGSPSVNNLPYVARTREAGTED